MSDFTFVNREEELKLLLSFVPPRCHTCSLVIIKAPSGYGKSTLTDRVVEYLKGIERNGRVAVLYSNKDYGCEWDYDWRNKRFLREDNTKFAVNIVVYAMT